ncbi:hypothetical protein Scep_027734 [Stephania cephalantha]|uniref:Uncharacterized protein n=1 Tax=Stephania cephalantha TaxID=152367 RepID=A0AAP0ED52_9MAGN
MPQLLDYLKFVLVVPSSSSSILNFSKFCIILTLGSTSSNFTWIDSSMVLVDLLNTLYALCA